MQPYTYKQIQRRGWGVDGDREHKSLYMMYSETISICYEKMNKNTNHRLPYIHIYLILVFALTPLTIPLLLFMHHNMICSYIRLFDLKHIHMGWKCVHRLYRFTIQALIQLSFLLKKMFLARNPPPQKLACSLFCLF